MNDHSVSTARRININFCPTMTHGRFSNLTMINSHEEWFLTSLMNLQTVAITEREIFGTVYNVELKYSKNRQIPGL